MTQRTKASALVAVDRLACSAGERLLFSDMSWELSAGEVLSIRGANGSGKSSLLRVLAGLRRIAHGSCTLAERFHYVGHALGLKTRLTGLDHLAFWRSLSHSSVEAELPATIAGFAALPIATLSRGQVQQVALSRLLVDPRPIWLLDEPTAPLDDAATAMFEALVRQHIAGGGVAVIATHRPLDLGPSGRELRIAS